MIDEPESRLPARAIPAAIAVAAATVALGLLPAAGRSALTRPRSPSAKAASSPRLEVTQVDYRLLLSRTSIRGGNVALAEIDAGRNPHDLRLRREGSSSTINGRLIVPGGRWEAGVHLLPGVYQLWCSLPEHARLGMHTTLRVTP